jgi:signal peptidase I
MSQPRPARTILGWCGQVVAWAVILCAVAVVSLTVLLPRVGGATPYTILTGSMQPHYPPGTLVVAKPVDVHDLAVGDIITYQLHSGDPTVVTHRIVATALRADGTTLVQTQGDANNTPDEAWVMPVQIKGELWYSVPYLGRFDVLMSGSQHEVLVKAAVGLLGTYALVMFVGAFRDRRRRPRGTRRAKATA